MIDEDDGLPVLTQVLRIGSGRTAHAPAQRHATTEETEESSLDEVLLSDQLVIGTEPRQDLEPYVPLTTPLADRSSREGETLARSSPSFTHPLILAFAEPVDAPTVSVEASTSDQPVSDDHEGAESHDAANDARDVAEAAPNDAASEVTTEAATEASTAREAATGSEGSSALTEVSTPANTIATQSATFDDDAFAARVQEAVLNGMSARIDTELDARIAQAMHTEVETALASLQANLREHLAGAMRDVVRRAVDDELARLREMQSRMTRE